MKTYTGTMKSCERIINTDDKEVYECVIQYPRKLVPEIIDVGASIGIIPQNIENEVNVVLKAFGW